MPQRLAANRRAILIAFYELERQTQAREFTIQELENQAPEVNRKTLRFHLNSTMDDGKYHQSDGTHEVEKVGKRDRLDLYRLTELGRAKAQQVAEANESG